MGQIVNASAAGRIAFLIFAALLAVLAAPTVAGQDPADHVGFYQVDFVWDDATQRNSSWGHVRVDHGRLLEGQELNRGYLQVYAEAPTQGWVVRNLALDETNTARHTSTSFDLGVPPGTDASELRARVEVTEDPVTTPRDGGEARMFSVEALQWNYDGVERVTEPPEAPDNDAYTFDNPEGDTSIAVTANPVNVHAADDQCYPMSMANSLGYLNETYDLDVPDPHDPGANGDETLVGQLDQYSGRQTSGPTSGSGIHATNMIPGKVSYLQDHNLDDDLNMTYQGWHGPSDPNGDWTVDGVTIQDEGDEVTVPWMCQEIRDGADLELVYEWPGGAHAVRIFGCGQVNGQPFVIILDDTQQTDRDRNNDDGLRWATWFLTDGDNDDRLNISGTNQEIKLVTSEKYTGSNAASPGPGALGIVAAGLAAAGLAARARAGGPGPE
jgi:hypothetical protein